MSLSTYTLSSQPITIRTYVTYNNPSFIVVPYYWVHGKEGNGKRKAKINNKKIACTARA